MDPLSPMWKSFASDLAAVDVDNWRDSPFMRKVVRTDDAIFTRLVNEFAEQQVRHSWGMVHSVLEVGSGSGDLCRKLLDYGIPSYDVVDQRDMLRILRSNLGEHRAKVQSYEVEELAEVVPNRNYDVFVSTNCLSEVPDDYRRWVIQNLMAKCKTTFIVDGVGPDYGSDFNSLLSNEMLEVFSKVHRYDVGLYHWPSQVLVGER